MKRWLPFAALGVALIVALAIGAARSGGNRSVAQRVQHITAQLKCPVCEGETIADSNALISRDIRADVQRRVEAGQSDHEITDYVVHQYPEIRLSPPTRGVGLLVWVLPLVVIAAAAIGLGLAFAGWRSRAGLMVTDADRALVEEALRHQ
jgi:cytochrome c-type biogenesis protein CcmH